MFHYLDLVFPIGTGILASVLIGIVLIKKVSIPAKIITVLTCLMFISTIPILYSIRHQMNGFDYKTEYGIKVTQGKINRCFPSVIRAWSDDLIDYWKPILPYERITKSLEDKHLVCLDSSKVPGWGVKWAYGLSFDNEAIITYHKDDKMIRKLFLHEFSHILQSSKDNAQCVSDNQHKLFKKYKFDF